MNTKHKKLFIILGIVALVIMLFFVARTIAVRSEKKNTFGDNIENEVVIPDEKELEQMAMNNLLDDLVAKYKKDDTTFSIMIKDLKTGVDASYNVKKLNSASVIKTYIMLNAFYQDSLGTQKLDEDTLSVIEKMITESNNPASTTLIDKYGFDRINETIQHFGFSDTELLRKMHDRTPPEGPSGKENYTSVKDITNLLERIYNGDIVSKEASKRMFSYLSKQKRTHKLPKYIKDKVHIASKTGELKSVENDVAIVSSDKYVYTIAVMVNDIPYDENNPDDSLKYRESIQEDLANLSVDVYNFFEEKYNG